MDGQPDTVIQDLQGAIPLADPASRLPANGDAWRAHQLHNSRTGITAEPKRPRGVLLSRAAQGDEIVEDDRDPTMPRLAP